MLLPEGSGKAGPVPEGSGDAEPMPEGPSEPKSSSIELDWVASTPISILDGLRLMSFNSYPTGTLILVPDSSPRA
jgi:hypothetical protein